MKVVLQIVLDGILVVSLIWIPSSGSGYRAHGRPSCGALLGSGPYCPKSKFDASP